MKNKVFRFLWYLSVGVLFVLGAYYLFTLGRPAPIPTKYELYNGITYRRIVGYLPHAMIAHVIIIDRREVNVRYLVTPPDEIEGGSNQARTTSQFLNEFGVQIAINGDAFFPWWSRSPVDYYPHSGDPVTPNGYAASNGTVYADGLQNEKAEPVLYISRRNEISFNQPPNKIHHAISGDRMLIQGGEMAAGLDDSIVHPRTAIGTNRNGRYVYLVVVDGRQPFYSAGVTFQELAGLFESLGAHYAMALDGGGSATLAIAGKDGQTIVLNSPIDSLIPGRERPVANHLGVFVGQ